MGRKTRTRILRKIGFPATFNDLLFLRLDIWVIFLRTPFEKVAFLQGHQSALRLSSGMREEIFKRQLIVWLSVRRNFPLQTITACSFWRGLFAIYHPIGGGGTWIERGEKLLCKFFSTLNSYASFTLIIILYFVSFVCMLEEKEAACARSKRDHDLSTSSKKSLLWGGITFIYLFIYLFHWRRRRRVSNVALVHLILAKEPTRFITWNFQTVAHHQVPK